METQKSNLKNQEEKEKDSARGENRQRSRQERRWPTAVGTVNGDDDWSKLTPK